MQFTPDGAERSPSALPSEDQDLNLTTVGSDRTLTPPTISLHGASKTESANRQSPRSPRTPSLMLSEQPVITFTSSGNTPGYVQEVNHAGPSNPGLMQTTTSSPLTRDGSNTGNGNYLTSTSPRSPPGSAMSTGGFFSSFRPSSPKVNLLQQNASATTSRDDTATFHSPLMRKGIDRERDNSLSGSESLPKKERRPSSVFEHVGGMLDRFGRRLHSRGDSRDDRHRLSNATAGLSGSAIDVGEGGGSVDEHSPNGSSAHMSPTANNVSPWDRLTGGQKEAASSGGPAVSWSPVLDEHPSESTLRPDMLRQASSGSGSGEGSAMSPSSLRFHTKRLSVMDRTLIQVTEDNERFSVVDISGLNSTAAIKERMMSKLHLFEEDPSCFALSRTEIGMSGHGGHRMNDDEVLALCWQSGDDKGTLKFLLHQIAPPSQPSHSMLPPPPSSNLSPQILPRELLNDSSTNTNTSTPTSYSRPPHSKSGSLSSRSSVGEMLGHGDSMGAGDSGSEASARLGGLHRVKATSRRAGGTGSISSAEDARSPVVAARSPPAPPTPLLAAVAEQESRNQPGSQVTPTSTGAALASPSLSTRPSRPERSEKRKGQSPSDSPVEEILDLDEPASASSMRGGSGFQRSNNKQRPSSSHAAYRTSLHGQWESEVGTSSSRSAGGPPVPSSPLSLQPSLPERAVSVRGPSHPPHSDDRPSSGLPKSLTPGGRDPREIDAADAAHMYLGHSSSPHNDLGSAPLPTMATGGQAHPSSALGIHNAKSVDDIRRRSRPSMPAVSEMPNVRREQQQQQHGGYPPPSRNQPHPPGPSVTAITRQGSADAHVGHRQPALIGPPAPFGHDPRHGLPTQFKPRTSVGFERERSSSFGSAGLPSQHQPGMVLRPPGPSSSAGFEVIRNNNGPWAGMMSPPPMARPMPAHSLHPYDGRFAPSPQPTPRTPVYTNEFGVRAHMQGQQQHHHQQQHPSLHHQVSDPRIMSPPFSSPRPHSLHEQQRFRPVTPSASHVRPTMVSQPRREDPFISAHFPASSSMTVSEFQRNPTGALQPGMTVQETMHHRQQPGGGYPARPADPREIRSMSARPRHDRSYEHQARPALQLQPLRHAQATPLQQQQHYHSQQQQHQQQAPSAPVANYQPPLRHGPPQERPSGKGPPSSQRPHTAAVDGSGPPTERSSGSSFTTVSSLANSSHRRNVSSEDRNNGGWVEETYSAPTSARSSRSESMGQESKAQAANQSIDSEMDRYVPYARAESQPRRKDSDSLEEADLINLRPLPKLPPQLGTGEETDGRNEDEDTLRATEWEKMLTSLADEGGERGVAGLDPKLSSSDMLSPKRSETNEPESSGASNTTAVPKEQTMGEGVEEEGGTFASFDDEDEYDEGGTWAQPLDGLPRKEALVGAATGGEVTMRPGDGGNKAAVTAEVSQKSPTSATTPPVSHRSLATSPRRPVLTLSIDPSVRGSPLLAENVSPKSVPATSRSEGRLWPPSKESPLPGRNVPSPSSSGINRRTSFARRDVDWAFRPPPEQLYDNLDDFFPKHDLDKPVLDNSSGLPASPQTGSPRADVASQPLGPTSPAPFSSNRSRFSHKKSIRIVAQDRKRFLERAEAAERRRAEGEGLNRRRSTKLWGTRVVEVTPGVEGQPMSSSSGSADSPLTDSGAKPVFKWVKGDLIGKGTYGRVYLALNATTGEMIAVKQVELPTTDSDREDARQKGVVSALKSEIETLKDLDHPNIVSYLGFEETMSYLSIFLEYVPGGSVGSCLRKHGKLDEATIKSFLQQILVGLNYLHNRGILHRDLKADNLLVDFNGIVKISDFGTVRKSEDIYGNIASMSIQGSIFWMAPEVVSLSRAGYSAKVDIWSLGCVVLEMFAGRRPWSDEEAVQAMFKIGAERRAPPIPPDVRLSRAAAHFLKTCFAVEPASRPTAQRLLEHVFPHILPGWHFSDSSLYRALHR